MTFFRSTYQKAPERGCAVLGQPQQVTNFIGFWFSVAGCGWSATQPRSVRFRIFVGGAR